jgi:Ca-activated chloride channel family protein
MMTFRYPLALLLLLVIPGMIYWYLKVEKKKKGAMRFSDLSFVAGIEGSYKILFRHVPPFLRMAAVALFILALARPQSGRSYEEVTTKGVDIVLLLDASQSMRAEDFKPANRLAVSKKVIVDFVGGRRYDRLGLVVFATEAFTLCPLTTDYDLLVNMLKAVNFNTVDGNSTAIGTALATATNRLRDSKAKSKVIVLLTDGDNNAGEIDPETAAKAAGALGIKIYAVGVGREGLVPIPIDHPMFGRQYQQMESRLNEDALKAIAAETRGRFFRAKNPKALKAIYNQIDDLEKTEIKSKTYTTYSELYFYLVAAGMVLLFLEILLANTVFRRIP